MPNIDPKAAVEGLEHVLMLIDREDDIHIDCAITCIEAQAEEIERLREGLRAVVDEPQVITKNVQSNMNILRDIARAALNSAPTPSKSD